LLLSGFVNKETSIIHFRLLPYKIFGLQSCGEKEKSTFGEVARKGLRCHKAQEGVLFVVDSNYGVSNLLSIATTGTDLEQHSFRETSFNAISRQAQISQRRQR